MLKLEQIKIIDADEIIIELLEPIVYTHLGAIAKTDEIILNEKHSAPYVLAKVVKVCELPTTPIHGEFAVEESANYIIKVGTIIMTTKNAMTPITFPVEDYARPSIASLNKMTIFAIIAEEDVPSNS